MKQGLLLGLLLSCLVASSGFASEYLVKFQNGDSSQADEFLKHNGGRLGLVSDAGHLFQWTTPTRAESAWRGKVEYVQSNHTIRLFANPSIEANRAAMLEMLNGRDLGRGPAFPDNPEIQPATGNAGSGADPLLSQAWGIGNIGADGAWTHANQGKQI